MRRPELAARAARPGSEQSRLGRRRSIGAPLLGVLLALPLPARAQEGWAEVGPGLELRYPRDHGAHPAYRTEWWYLTGRLRAADGRRFGYQLTIFRSGLDARPLAPGDSPLRARQALAGHLVIADLAAGRTLLAERLRRAGSPLARASEEDLDLVLEDWSLAREAGPDGVERGTGTGAEHLRLAAGDRAIGARLALELVPEKPLVLHGDRGRSVKGDEPGNASAYASWTRLATAGTLALGGEELSVQGSSWFDHEFGSSVLGEGVVGWDWFGLQLDDGRELMAFLLRRADGSATPASGGTLVERDGTALPLARDDFRVTARGTWTSPHTGATYPAGWRLEVPAAGLVLALGPLLADAELLTTGSTGVAYWEGPVAVTGSVAGGGYAELTGYAGPMTGRF